MSKQRLVSSQAWHKKQEEAEAAKAKKLINEGNYTLAILSLVRASRHQEAKLELGMHV